MASIFIETNSLINNLILHRVKPTIGKVRECVNSRDTIGYGSNTLRYRHRFGAYSTTLDLSSKKGGTHMTRYLRSVSPTFLVLCPAPG